MATDLHARIEAALDRAQVQAKANSSLSPALFAYQMRVIASDRRVLARHRLVEHVTYGYVCHHCQGVVEGPCPDLLDLADRYYVKVT